MRLYLATGNHKKVEELQAMLAAADLRIEVCPASDAGGMPEVEEDQDSFAGNALKKGRALAARLTDGSWALADDSGLCVDALGGAPGVRSARFAGESASDADNVRKLLQELDAIEEVNRLASFQCNLALVSSKGEEHVFEGSCPGRIIREPRGSGGFGYDPVFIPADREETFAQLSREEKAALSHRGAAMRQLMVWLGTKEA